MAAMETALDHDTVATGTASGHDARRGAKAKPAAGSRTIAAGVFVLYLLATLVLTMLGLLAWSANSVIWLSHNLNRASAAAVLAFREAWRRPPAARDVRTV